MTDLYETLGVDKSVDDKELKRAYHKRARETHPDTGGSKAEFQAVEKAYRVLKDPDERAYYDRTGREKDDGPSPEDWAKDLLSQMFEHLLNQEEMLSEDVFGRLREFVKDVIRQNKQTSAAQKRKVKRAQKALEKTRRKQDANPIMLQIMEQALKSAETLLEKFETEKQIFETALSLVDGYSFDPDPKDPFQGPDLHVLTEDDFKEAFNRAVFRK